MMKTVTRYCQALDLVDNPQKIKEYETIHQKIWPEVAQHIRQTGVLNMQLWRIGNRLFMIMDVGPEFTFERSDMMSNQNPIIDKWEKQMWDYQIATPWTPKGQKWVLMDKIFDLQEQE